MHKVEILLVGGARLFGEVESDRTLEDLSSYILGLPGGSFILYLPRGQVAYIATEHVAAIMSR